MYYNCIPYVQELKSLSILSRDKTHKKGTNATSGGDNYNAWDEKCQLCLFFLCIFAKFMSHSDIKYSPNFLVISLNFQFYIEISPDVYFTWCKVGSNLFFYIINNIQNINYIVQHCSIYLKCQFLTFMRASVYYCQFFSYTSSWHSHVYSRHFSVSWFHFGLGYNSVKH